MKLPLFLFAVLLSAVGCKGQRNNGMVEPTSHTHTTEMTSHDHNPYYSRTDIAPLRLLDEEWKKVLPDSLYEVSRKKGTEYAFSGKFWNYTGLGTYYCAACGNALFKSDAKFASSCGWPSFFETLRPNSCIYEEDNSYGMVRTEVMCGRCEGHLGHIFDDGPKPTGKRYCMNSIALDFEPEK